MAAFAASPYFRAMFASLIKQSGVMLPPLPIISDGPRWVSSPKTVRKLEAAAENKSAGARNRTVPKNPAQA